MKLYLVRNKEGKYFRAKGYGGYGQTWVDNIQKAKFYTSIVQARSRASYFLSQWPEYGCPDILEFTLAEPVILNLESEIVKAIQKRKAAKERRVLKNKQIGEEIRKLQRQLK